MSARSTPCGSGVWKRIPNFTSHITWHNFTNSLLFGELASPPAHCLLCAVCPPRRWRSSRDARAMCGQGGLVFMQTQIRNKDRGSARSKKEARYRTGYYEHEAAWWANRDTRVWRPLEI